MEAGTGVVAGGEGLAAGAGVAAGAQERGKRRNDPKAELDLPPC